MMQGSAALCFIVVSACSLSTKYHAVTAMIMERTKKEAKSRLCDVDVGDTSERKQRYCLKKNEVPGSKSSVTELAHAS